MLQDSEYTVLENNTNVILETPAKITTQTLIEIYNTVYAHCTSPKDKFCIEGEYVYLFIKEKLLKYTSNLQFKPRIQEIAKQLEHLSLSCKILTNSYSYLERYYIKISEFDKIEHLFYQNVYYNYVYPIEESLLSLIFLEIETAREVCFFKNSLDIKEIDTVNLRRIISEYSGMLVITGQEEKLKRFYQRYLKGFSEATDLNVGIGKLLRRVYIELYIIHNVLGERNLKKEVVEIIEMRMEPMLAYLFKKIEGNEQFKHIFTIINVMDDDRKELVSQRYCEMVKKRMEGVSTFEEFYNEYVALKEQIAANKMTGYQEILDKKIREEFKTDEAKKRRIGQSLIKIINEEILKNPEEMESVALMKMGIEDPSRDFYSTSFLKLRKGPDVGRKYNIFLMIKLMGMTSDEDLAQEYTNDAQARLLFGSSVYIEHFFMESLAKALGANVLSRLKNTVESVMSRKEVAMNVCILQLAKCFWRLEKETLNLPSVMEDYLKLGVSRLSVTSRDIIEYNYRYSPVVLQIGKVLFRMSSTSASLLLHVDEQPGMTVERLKDISGDFNFDQTLKDLIRNKILVVSEDGTLGIRVPDGEVGCNAMVDLFETESLQSHKSGEDRGNKNEFLVLKAWLMRQVKRRKTIKIGDIKKEREVGDEVLAECLKDLEETGYLSVSGEDVSYIP